MKAIIGNKRYDCMVIERVKVRRKRGNFMKEWSDAIGVGLIFAGWFLILYFLLA